MKNGKRLMAIAILLLAGQVFAPVVCDAQGRGRGQAKKSIKFVNGHDARDGRFDGRGPRIGLVRTGRLRRHRNRIWWRRHRRARMLRIR